MFMWTFCLKLLMLCSNHQCFPALQNWLMSQLIRHTGIPGLWTQELDAGLWTLDSGLWTLDSGRWTLDAGRWTQDSGRWTLDAGL